MLLGEIYLYAGAVVAAFVLDLWLIRQGRRYWQRHRAAEAYAVFEVRVFGQVSPVLTWLKFVGSRLPVAYRQVLAQIRSPGHWRRYLVEWLAIVAVAILYSGSALLDFDANQLQQTGEHNESATLPLLAEIGLSRYHEIPLWNPYMLTGFPHVGDLINHFWHPVSTLPVILWGGLNGMKVSVFVAFLLAGIGQWWFAHVFGVRNWARLWASLLFMLSGGLALLWRVGWYELLLGIAWFPWCFASLWWALQRHDRASLAIAALCIAMVLTAGGGYYPFYLSVGLGVLFVMALIGSRPTERWIKVRRTAVIVALSAGLVAVMLLPMIDGYRYIGRDAGMEREQRYSQPIVYALINYVVSAPDWFRTEILGTASGWNWFYIGSLPLAALILSPLALARNRKRRVAFVALSVLTVVILAWQASRFAPVKYIYEWIPFLYNLRFPNRLLIVATSPLLVMGGLGFQALFGILRLWSRGAGLVILGDGMHQVIASAPLRWVWQGILALILLLSVRDVYTVNRGFAFAPVPRNPKPALALSWLKSYDPGLYYTNIGGGAVYWNWTPAAYELEMPIVNFDYGRRLKSFDLQRQPLSPFFATPKYMLALPNEKRPDNAVMLQDFDGVGLWLLPDALPFAFSVRPALLQQSGVQLTGQNVSPLKARFDGPNRVVVTGAPAQAGDLLVVLVSDYPGWQLSIDGRPAKVSPINYYLGAEMVPGEHTYTFAFHPIQYYIGMVISLLTGVFVVGVLASHVFRFSFLRQGKKVRNDTSII